MPYRPWRAWMMVSIERRVNWGIFVVVMALASVVLPAPVFLFW